VDGVGDVQAYPPTPASTALLAQSVRGRGSDDKTRGSYLYWFVRDHLTSEGFDDLLLGMWDGQIDDDDAVHKTARAVATWGTARPYLAVATLASISGQHWRTVRAHLIDKGIPDPMLLPSMHALLDVVETMVVESIHADKPRDTQRKRDEFYDTLYKPEIVKVPVNGDGYRPVPEGFDDTDDVFDRFAKVAR
jgi:hypothetical protein